MNPMTRTIRSLALLVLLALPLAACVENLLPGSGPPPALFTLTPKNTFATDLPQASWQLVVEEPLASGGLNTERIALQSSPTRVEYFAGSQWTVRAPQMVQTLLVESFENSGRIVSVGRQAIGLRSDFNLLTEMREFQAEYGPTEPAPTIRVRLNAKLIRQPERAIIASQNFEAQATATGTDMESVVAAFDVALGKVLRRTVEWTLRTAG